MRFQILEDFVLYRDQFGLNQLTTNGQLGNTTQNGALFTVEYLICLLEDSSLPDEVKMLEIERIKEVLQALEIDPGLSLRSPWSRECDSMDNSCALLSFFALFPHLTRDLGFPQRMRNHGLDVHCRRLDASDDGALDMYPIAWILNGFKRPKNYWNNRFAEEFCVMGWFGRSPGFMGLLDLAATGKTTWFRGLSLFVGQFLGCFKNKGDADARKLPYVAWYFLKNLGLTWKFGYWLWTRILMRQYPNGMRDVYAMYYQDQNHPIRRYSKRYFGEKV